MGTLVFDTAGNLYGTTNHGWWSHRDQQGCGSVFKLIPSPDGTWTEIAPRGRWRRLIICEQVGNLEEAAVFRQHFDGVASVAKDAAIAVNKGDAAQAGRSIHERRIVGHEPKVVGAGLDLPQVHGPDCPILNGQVVVC
jgi:hypothetical protein